MAQKYGKKKKRMKGGERVKKQMGKMQIVYLGKSLVMSSWYYLFLFSVSLKLYKATNVL